MKQKFALVLAATLGVAACSDMPEPTTPSAPQDLQITMARSADEVIPDRYIVTLREGAIPEALLEQYGVRADFVYRRALNGFAGHIPPGLVQQLLRDERIERVEEDAVVYATTTQTGATWGLDRSDQRSLPLTTTYDYNSTGAGVTAYIIDTGIRFAHSDFGGRATSGYDAIDGGTADDCNGHGTHVAGTVGGATYGIAKGVNLVAVRVLDCGGSGSTSGVIAGIDWVTAQHAVGTPAVANMSLGGGASSSMDAAVNSSIADGVSYSVAAGNGNFIGIAQDACNYSPARVANAITVGATDKTDKKASFSNYGTCVDLFAPGVDITSAWSTSNTATNTISGTSMAAPHVAGAAALYLQGNPSATSQQVRDALVNNATANAITSIGTGSPNLLLYTGVIAAGPTPPVPVPAPVASYTYTCSLLACSFDATPSTNASSYSWNFGDGTSGTGVKPPPHQFASRRSYTVTLTVTGDGGPSSPTSKTITCNGKRCS